MGNGGFIDWNCQIRKLNYIKEYDKKTVRDCYPREVRRVAKSATVGSPNPK